MNGIEIIIGILVAFMLGFMLSFILLKRVYEAKLERWKVKVEHEIRKDAINRSRSVLRGKLAEQFAPLLPEFLEKYDPSEARFIGDPIDYVIFRNLRKESDVEIVFLDVKTGKASLTSEQRKIAKAIEEGKVRWETFHMKEEKHE